MSRQMLVSLGILILTFVSGVAVGLFLGGGTSSTSDISEKATGASSSGSSFSAEGEERIESNSLLSNRIRELEKDLAEQKKAQQTVLADRLAFFKKYRSNFILVGPFGFGGNPKLSAALVELLGLSKEEQQAVEQHLAEAKSEMDALEKSKAVLVKQSANSATFEIPAAPEGADIKAQMDGLLSADIGDDRADLLKSYFQNSDFGDFAEQKRQIEISWTEQNGSPLYTTKDSYFGPDGNVNTSSGSTGNSLPPEYQKYLSTNSAP